MMGIFLLQQDASEPTERRRTLDQPLFDARQNGFA
jgi:hypothetical protein